MQKIQIISKNNFFFKLTSIERIENGGVDADVLVERLDVPRVQLQFSALIRKLIFFFYF